MATVNLGRIKPVFRGAYSNGTAYVVDDIVTHGNESFICIQAHGAGTQATSQTAYWTKLAAKGVDGTDVGTTITTQGDILYRDGSGLQRLAKGTAGQVLKMNSSANAPEWGTDSGGKILKVYQDYDTGNISTSSTSFVDTGLEITLTPASASSDFLLLGDIGVHRHQNTGSSLYVQYTRNGTAIRTLGEGYMGYNATSNDRGYPPMNFSYIDAPNTTSSVTYKFQWKAESSGQTKHSLGSRHLTIFEISGGVD